MLLSDFLQNVNFIVTYLRKIALHVQILMQLDFLEIMSKKYASINNNIVCQPFFQQVLSFAAWFPQSQHPIFVFGQNNQVHST